MLPGQYQGHVEQQLEPLQDFSSQGSPGKLTREENKIKKCTKCLCFGVCSFVYFFMVLFVTWGFFHCNSLSFNIRDHTLHYNIGQGP